MRILRFGAIWCPSCLVMKSRWQKLQKTDASLVFTDIEYDEQPELVKKYQIGTLLPVVLFLSDEDKELVRLVGEKPLPELKKVWEEWKR